MALFDAIREGDRNKIRRLLTQSDIIMMDTAYLGETPLHVALKYRSDINIIKLLLSKDTFDMINTQTEEGDTPLYYAIKYNNSLDVIRLLLTKSNNVNDGYLLHLAIGKDNLELVKLLLEYGADVNMEDEDGDKPLHIVIIMSGINEKKIIKLLLRAGANINAKNKFGSTPLLLAVHVRNLKIIKLLLKFGATIDFNYDNESEEIKMILDHPEKYLYSFNPKNYHVYGSSMLIQQVEALLLTRIVTETTLAVIPNELLFIIISML